MLPSITTGNEVVIPVSKSILSTHADIRTINSIENCEFLREIEYVFIFLLDDIIVNLITLRL